MTRSFTERLLENTPRVTHIVASSSGRWVSHLVRENDLQSGTYLFRVRIYDTLKHAYLNDVSGSSIGQLQRVGHTELFSYIKGGESDSRGLFVFDPVSRREQALVTLDAGLAYYSWHNDGEKLLLVKTESVAPPQDGFYRTTDLEYVSATGAYRTKALTEFQILSRIDPGKVSTHTIANEDVRDLCWLPGARGLAFTLPVDGQPERAGAARTLCVYEPERRFITSQTPYNVDLFQIIAEQGGEAALSLGAALSPDGYSLGYTSIGVWRTYLDGSDSTCVTPRELSVSYSSQTFRQVGDTVLFAYDDDGRVVLGSTALDPHDEGVQILYEASGQVNAFDSSLNGETVALVVSSGESAGDVVLIVDGECLTITDYGMRLMEAIGHPEYQEVSAVDEDGYETKGWLFIPNAPPPYPCVMLIKGGPYTQFGYSMSGHASFEEARYLQASGFAVALCNPRGSSGRGQAFAESLGEKVAENTERSLLAFLERCLQVEPIDSSRIALFGGSFGGYMVAWLMSRQLGIKAGIAERGCYDLLRYRAVSPSGSNLVAALWGEGDDKLRSQSPSHMTAQFAGSLMIIHSDNDAHAPFVDAQGYYYDLKRQGAAVELCVAVGGDHELSRSGPVGQRLCRINLVVQWLLEQVNV